MKYNETDFNYSVNAEGYMIRYKGKNIGGAGIMGKSTARGKGRMNNIKMYVETAKRDISHLINGIGSAHMINAIEEINQNAD